MKFIECVAVTCICLAIWGLFASGRWYERQVAEVRVQDTKQLIEHAQEWGYREGLTEGAKQDKLKQVNQLRYCSLHEYILGRREPGLAE